MYVIIIANNVVYNDEYMEVTTVSDVNKLLEQAISEIDFVEAEEIFLVKDLFKGYKWKRIPRSDRLLLGTLFLNYVNTVSKVVKPIEKTSSNQQQYKKIIDKVDK